MEEKPHIQIPRVRLGSQGLEVSRLGFGCGGLSGMLNAPLSHDAGCSVIKEAFQRGITFFDTADMYGDNHDNEIMVGKALKQLGREKIQLATKFGITKLEEGQFGVKGTPEYVRQCCEASLKYLDVDYIDLYYQHRVDTSVPIEETMEELKKLVEEGKIKYIGLSEPSVDTIRRAHAIHPITALQMEYSLWTRDIEDEIVPLCRIGYDIIPIPGTAKVKNLDNNIGSLAVKLTQEDLKEIGDAVPINEVGGERDLAILSKYNWKNANTPIKVIANCRYEN